MKVKGNKQGRIVLSIGLAAVTLLAYGVFMTPAEAQVTGKCENCHTMHNSQSGATQVHVGVGAGWNPGTNQLTNGDTFTERTQLLRSDCVGCHSATNNTTTIINDGNGNKVPIVFNMGGTYPANALAGGNFALNTGSANIYGHNVQGISNIDTLAVAPGTEVGCGVSCHDSLALSDAATTSPFNYDGISQGNFNGCKACHNKVGHHNSSDTSYRFLGGHNEGGGVNLVEGKVGGLPAGASYEDPNWEVAANSTTHNFYKKSGVVKDSMGAFCAGCHQDFHANGLGPDVFSGIDNGGDDNTDGSIVVNSAGANPWLRHPTNVNIPLDPLGEYVAMDGAAYNPAVPVAQDSADLPNQHSINAGDQVMCLSCHRAHASEYPDALRFNYSKMNAHSAAVADQGTGCFYCHTTKDT